MIILTPRADYKFNGRNGRDDPSDDHDLDYKVVKETWVENVYHIDKGQFWDTGVFVDIGANIGAVSLYVDDFNKSKDADTPDIKVYAVEPEPNNLELLRANIEQNPTHDITVVDKAIWWQKQDVVISNRGGNSSIVDEKLGDRVQAITIEDLFNQYKIKEADVMKIDIEGAEYDLLIRTPVDVLMKIKFLTLEFDKNTDGKFGVMVDKLSRCFGLQILGSPDRGGYIYGTRY